MFGGRHPRRQGDLGEAAAIEWLTRAGATVFVPLGHSLDCDLTAEWDAERFAVQVKTSSCFRKGRFDVTLATRGGNQSWSGHVKKLDPSRCDYLFVLVADGRKWFIPMTALDCRSHMALGGPKYAAFEVDRDGPDGRPTLHSSALQERLWGDARAVKGSRL